MNRDFKPIGSSVICTVIPLGPSPAETFLFLLPAAAALWLLRTRVRDRRIELIASSGKSASSTGWFRRALFSTMPLEAALFALGVALIPIGSLPGEGRPVPIKGDRLGCYTVPSPRAVYLVELLWTD